MAGHPVTPKTGQIAIEEAAERPYQQAVDHLAGGHGIGMGKELLENLAKTVGAYWIEQDLATSLCARTARSNPPAELSAEDCLVFADGVMVHTDGAWHEARVGTVRSVGPDGRQHKSSIARTCSVEDFEQDLWRHACRMGYQGASVKAFIADGSHWLWNMAERRFPTATKIVDFWHVCEHVSKCAAAFYGDGSEEARRWSLAVCGTLRAGQVEAALRSVEALNPRRSKTRREAKHELVTYLTNNRGRMDYPRYEALALPIGSGEVEAQCKTLVQARCKQAGMRWHSSGLQSLLRVRCAVRDGRYGRDFGRWPDNILAWQVRRKRSARQAA